MDCNCRAGECNEKASNPLAGSPFINGIGHRKRLLAASIWAFDDVNGRCVPLGVGASFCHGGYRRYLRNLFPAGEEAIPLIGGIFTSQIMNGSAESRKGRKPQEPQGAAHQAFGPE